jgi:uncharacterized phage-associated protein
VAVSGDRDRRMAMATVFDVAAYILKKLKSITAMKLQKLVYYSQAWSLVWDEKPLFREPIEAWANGPVVRSLYNAHKGRFLVTRTSLGNRDANALTPEQQETVEAVLKFYGGETSQWLSDLSHRERPWREARAGLKPGERGNHKITHASMAEYYGSLS